MRRSGRLGLLGGTFDPIHIGHLDAADAARAALGLDGVLFVPTHDQPLRPVEPRITGYQRFALAALAVSERPQDAVSDIELTRPGPSYTADTLRELHADGWRAAQLFFILGTDAFAEIAKWHGFPSFLDLAHFIVIARPGVTIDEATARIPELRSRMSTATGDAEIGLGSTRIFLVHATTHDVSSTQIRDRIAAGRAIDDLVPAPVARHILKHQLYGAVDDLHGENERCQS